jgi:hypothetical protein
VTQARKSFGRLGEVEIHMRVPGAVQKVAQINEVAGVSDQQ